MKTGARQSVISALIGVLISIVGAVIQFLMIYWILRAYGSSINGFIRITTSLSILGGQAEGALGVTTVVMLMRPMADSDWISANEIISTTRKKYHKNILTSSFLITLVAILYPLELAIFPMVLGHETQLHWGIITIDPKTQENVLISVWELVGIILIFGSKQIISSSFFGIYENIIMADQKNGVRKIIILFVDILVYGSLLALLGRAFDGPKFLHPIIPLLVLLVYAPIRGYLMKFYVMRYYSWIKIYSDFNSFSLLRASGKMWKANLGKNLMMNADLLLLFVVLGASSLTVTSMLSLYMLIGVNLRLILTNLIIGFREYFIGVISRDGRLQWEAYSKYELYTFIIAVLAFIFMSIIAPYFVTGLYGQTIFQDLTNQTNSVGGDITQDLLAQWGVFGFIFTSPIFSIIYAGTVAFILLLQGQITLIQAKGRFGEVANSMNIIALIYTLVELVTIFSINFILKQSADNTSYLKIAILVFYSIKVFFMTAAYIYLWQYTWKFVTYNSTFKYIFSNLLSLLTPIVLTILLNYLLISVKYPLVIDRSADKAPEVSLAFLFTILIIVGALGLFSSLVLPMIFRPQVGISIILGLPIIKQVVSLRREESKLKRFQQANVHIDELLVEQKQMIAKAFFGIEEDLTNKEISETDFLKKYQTLEKPKVYKIKGTNRKVET